MEYDNHFSDSGFIRKYFKHDKETTREISPKYLNWILQDSPQKVNIFHVIQIYDD